METDIMSFKIVVDSCCELPEEYLQDPRFEIVPLFEESGSMVVDIYDYVWEWRYLLLV